MQLPSNSEDYRGKMVRFTDWQPASLSSANHIILTRPDNALLSVNDDSANVSRSSDQKLPHRKTQTKMRKFLIRVIDYQGKLLSWYRSFYQNCAISKAYERKYYTDYSSTIYQEDIFIIQNKKLLICLSWHLIYIHTYRHTYTYIF